VLGDYVRSSSTVPAVSIDDIFFDAGSGEGRGGEPEMVKVEGCTPEQGDDCGGNEKSAHNVTLSSFQIGKYEVTQAQWKAVMGTTLGQQRDKANPSWSLSGEGDNYPVYYVSWDETQEFISRLNEATGSATTHINPVRPVRG
jgi:formylglycine-generating enzyme required for sulfatase activity